MNKQDLRKNLKFFQIPQASIQSVYSKLAMRVFDVYANILKGMYSARHSGGSIRSGVSFSRNPIDGKRRVMRRMINKINNIYSI